MFIAPTEELETEIIEFCLNKLNLTFGEFWYNWFSSSRVKTNGNHTIHINTNEEIDITKLKSTFSNISFVKDIFKIVRNNSIGDEYIYQYYIHFKSDIYLENK